MEYINTKKVPETPIELFSIIQKSDEILCNANKIKSIYLLSTSLIDKKTKIPILKLGYSSSSAKRRVALQEEYNCYMYPIDVTLNRTRRDEEFMHKYITYNFSDLCFVCNISGVKRMELYLYDIKIINFYNECKDISTFSLMTSINNKSIDNKSVNNKTVNNKIIEKIEIIKFQCEYCKTTCATIKILAHHKKHICHLNKDRAYITLLEKTINDLKTENNRLKINRLFLSQTNKE